MNRRTNMIMVLFCCVYILLVIQLASSAADFARPLVPRIDGGVAVDGKLDEPCWASALVFELGYEIDPGENTDAPVRTEVHLLYDENNLYAAFRCFDPSPSAIRAYLRERDNIDADDYVGIVLDTFNDERRSFEFMVSAAGVQYDRVKSSGSSNTGWDAIWECASEITDQGYIVEIAVPFSSLSFQRKAGTQTWGFDAVRYYPRDHRHMIGLFPRDRNNNCYLCQAVKIDGFEGARPGRNVEINPTLVAVSTDERTDMPGGGMQEKLREESLGVTTRWGITPNINISFTWNPDFSHVEADAMLQDINQPFELFFTEKRPFFTEGAEVFQTVEEIVYTRMMREPEWGFKLTGKEGRHTVGAYLVKDEITNIIFPGSQRSSAATLYEDNISSAFRYKYDFSSRFAVGVLATSREGDEYHNRTTGCDLDITMTGKDHVRVLLMNSDTGYPVEIANGFDQPGDAFGGHLFVLDYDHAARDWGWWLDYREASPGFRADLGYYTQVGHRSLEGGWNYKWIGDSSDPWTFATVYGYFGSIKDWQGGKLTEAGQLSGHIEGPMQSYLAGNITVLSQLYQGEYFDQTRYSLDGRVCPAAGIRLWCHVNLGDRIDYTNVRQGRRFRINPEADINFGKHLNINIDYDFDRMTVNDDRLYSSHIINCVGIYKFNVRTLLRAIIQYSHSDYNPGNYLMDVVAEKEHLFTQVLFSYKVNPRTLLFLGYSGNHYATEQYPLTQSDRTLFFKVGYALTM